MLSIPRVNLSRWLLARLSVRSRILTIALIPVVAFLANGAAFVAGEIDVDRSFASLQRAAGLADASQEFKGAIAGMRTAARDFGQKPSQSVIEAFHAAYRAAELNLATIDAAVDETKRKELGPLHETLKAVERHFGVALAAQQALGFDDRQGVRQRMMKSAIAVEQLIHEDMSWLTESDSAKLLISLLTMRRYETEYRLVRLELPKSMFNSEIENFYRQFDAVIGADILKEQLRAQVKTYADTFAEWIALMDKIAPSLAVIDIDAANLLPAADAIIASARQGANSASAALAAAQARTRNLIVAIGIAAVVIGLAFSLMIGGSITRPLNGLAAAMKRLADGDTSVKIPATGANDELGAMARTVLVFRDNMVERERLAASQAEMHRARDERGEVIAATITRFEMSVDQALNKVRGAAQRLDDAATQLNGAADMVSAEARTAESRVGIASGNVTAAAGSVEELAASIGEIAGQAHRSTQVANRAVEEAQRTVSTMSDLGDAANRIGEVVGLIQAIAGQTNLLALNATIEAARAGEAGRGFAVVASEVKSLAGQTAKATEEIASQVGAIQSAVADAAQAIEQVNGIITEISTIATTVAATVEEQNRAVASIAADVSRASDEARSGAEAISRVAGASSDARATAVDVKSLADALSHEAESLDGEVRRFLADVQAA